MHEYFAPRLQFFGSPNHTRGQGRVQRASIADSAPTDGEVPWELARELDTVPRAQGRDDERRYDDRVSDRDDSAFDDRPIEPDDDAISLDDDVIDIEDDELTVE